MEPRIYIRLLARLLALPIIALGLLAIALSYGIATLYNAGRVVDRSDRILTRANHLFRLMVDEETGLRGFLLTRDPAFLEPLHEADAPLQVEFTAIARLVSDNPEQAARLRRLQARHDEWRRVAAQEIASAGRLSSAPEVEAHMLERKQAMDDLRAQAEDFIRAETDIRRQGSMSDKRIDRSTGYGLVGFAALVALLLTWETQRVFRNLTGAYNRQISEVQRQREESFAREQWLSTTLRSIGDGVIACDTDGKISFMNAVAEKLTGWKEAEAQGRMLAEVFRICNEYTRVAVESPVDKVRRLGAVVGLANHTVLTSRDSREICIDDSGAPIRDSNSRLIGVVLVFRDISDRRVSERALIRAEKLAAAGRLAASIAHEVNNPLEGLMNLIFLARGQKDSAEVDRLLLRAEGELKRVAQITRQALGFYRETSNPIHFNPAPVVREVTEFYSARAVSQGVTFAVKTNTNVEVFGTPGELRQILSNLLANSLDACLQGSKIRVQAATATDPRDFSRVGVRITVADTGCGIPQEHLDRIFEPFFTTKDETGTGLGLWVSRELVEKHGGRLRVRSRYAASNSGTANSGTVFSLFLPRQGRDGASV